MKFSGVMIYVADVPATVRFYEQALGLVLRFMNDEKQYAQMETGDSVLAFADETAAAHLGLPVRVNRSGADVSALQIPFETDDIAAAFARVVTAGGVVVNAPTQKPWGQTLGHVRDNNGILIEISTPQDESWHDGQPEGDE